MDFSFNDISSYDDHHNDHEDKKSEHYIRTIIKYHSSYHSQQEQEDACCEEIIFAKCMDDLSNASFLLSFFPIFLLFFNFSPIFSNFLQLCWIPFGLLFYLYFLLRLFLPFFGKKTDNLKCYQKYYICYSQGIEVFIVS